MNCSCDTLFSLRNLSECCPTHAPLIKIPTHTTNITAETSKHVVNAYSTSREYTGDDAAVVIHMIRFLYTHIMATEWEAIPSEASLHIVPPIKWKHTSKNNKTKNSQKVSCAHNLFADILESSEHMNTAQVHNLVGTSRIQSSLETIDLPAVSNLLPNSLCDKQKFAAITIRLREPTCTVLLFTSGKMLLTGCKSLLDCILASKIVTNLMRQGFPGNVFTLEPIKIQNIVGNALVPLLADEVLDLNRFYTDFNIFCTYQPNMFPGLIYRPTNLPIVLLIFFSGKAFITGAKNIPDVYYGWNEMRKLLRTYNVQATLTTNK